MADKEMYDYLDTISATYTTTTLSVAPQNVIQEEGSKNQEILKADDNSEEVISHSDDSIFYCTLQFNHKQSSDIGTIMDFYHDSSKANAMARSFQWDHPEDGHTYVVRFDGKLTRERGRPAHQAMRSVRLRVLGRIAD